MASLSSAKSLGGVGGILVFILGLSLVGRILTLVSLNEISDVVRDRSIFDDALITGITAIIGSIALLVFLVSGAFSTLIAIGGLAFGAAGVLAAVGTLAFFWIFAIVSAIFLKRAYEKTGQWLNVNSFATAGLLYLIGALTAIILVGFLILFIALIFQVIAYFSIPDQFPVPVAFQPPSAGYAPPIMQQPVSASQPSQDFKFCHKCGARIAKVAEYCPACGTKQS
jgi:uncharacterized membrane protein/ribosomal protein L40E